MRWLLPLALVAPVAAQVTAPPGIAMAQLVGRYAFSEEGITATIDLRADGSFTYRTDDPGSVARGEKPESARWDGRWRTRSATKIVLENAPGAEPFYLRGNSVDLAAGLIEIEAGQAGLPMRRVGPARGRGE